MKPSACGGLFLMYGVPLLLMAYANYAGSFAFAWVSLLWMIMVSFLIIILSGDKPKTHQADITYTPSLSDDELRDMQDKWRSHFTN